MAGIPVTALIALAASAASTGMQVAANRQSQSAMNEAVEEELARQRTYRKKGESLYETSAAESTEPVARAQVKAGEQQRLETMGKVANIPVSTSESAPIAQSSVNVVAPKLAQHAGAAAKLGGYQDWALRQWIKNLRAQENLRILQNMAAGSEQILPYELQGASTAGSALRTAGQVVGNVGMFPMLTQMLNPGVSAATKSKVPQSQLRTMYDYAPPTATETPLVGIA